MSGNYKQNNANFASSETQKRQVSLSSVNCHLSYNKIIYFIFLFYIYCVNIIVIFIVHRNIGNQPK